MPNRNLAWILGILAVVLIVLPLLGMAETFANALDWR